MSPVSKKEFQEAVGGLHKAVERVETGIAESARGIIGHFNQSQGQQNIRLERIEKRLNEMDIKIDAIMEMLATRKELHNLVRALKAKGVELEESEIFVS